MGREQAFVFPGPLHFVKGGLPLTEKKLNILVLAGILGIDGYYLFQSFTARKYSMVFIGPYEFPKIIGVVLAILCLVALGGTMMQKDDDTPFRIGNLLYVVIPAASICGLLFLWQTLGLFYVWAPLFLLILFFTYRDEGGRFSRKNILVNAGLTAGIVGMIYVCFQLLMNVRL